MSRDRVVWVLCGLVVAVPVAAGFGALDMSEQSFLDAQGGGLAPAEYVVVDPSAGPTTPPVPVVTEMPAVTTAPSVAVGPPPTVPLELVVPDAPPVRGSQAQITETLPPPFVWSGEIPGYYGAPKCDQAQASAVAVAMFSEGASPDSVRFMLRTISRESGCRHWVRNDNPGTGDDSFSLCQLNARAGHFGSNGVLAGWDRWRMLDDFVYAAQGCAEMWSICGRGPWQPPYSCRVPEELR